MKTPDWIDGVLWLAVLAISVGFSGTASAQSIEDKLRSQLRSTTEQLRTLQDSQAQEQADKTQAEQQRDQALAGLKQAQANLAAAQGKSSAEIGAQRALAAEKAGRAQDEQQLAKYKSAYEDLLAQSHARDTEHMQTQTALKLSQSQMQMCVAKNVQLYQVGQQVLSAYEHVGLGTVLESREPFAQSTRVKYEQIVQDYGDQLYAGKFDAHAAVASSAATASSPVVSN